ncbi:aryl-sulfate sulfotransferase [Candidatus Halobonum tyrrellensis]|uniref:Arylsulfotransferase n=1 Tax=Candidatus Halobonum tyrrellensis G22 TaxID=1324957 RepID=V4HEY6_9EURY|nr:aryl-sulfate sulfotransferase [Candidatus Halobonum tyrrellensis]ESP89270.1 arylsulfotransferase [Candidatus Halobonum tyrrellensis G22]
MALTSQSGRWAARTLALICVLGLVAPAAVQAVGPDRGDTAASVGRQAGAVTDPANGTTVVSIQGFHFEGQGSTKKPAGLVGVGPRGSTLWELDGTKRGATWFYDVDPLSNGNLLVVSTTPLGTVVFELNPETRERVWEQQFDIRDTHDVDMLPNGNLLVANMRNWNESAGRSDDRLFVYNRTTDEVEWEWYFRNHYPASTDGGYAEDWSHVNDVDRIAEGRYLVSPRNFDQVIVVDRSTGEITERLGSDGNYDVLYEQHNPDWLVSESGDPTILVADSENDRVVEYALRDGEWTEVWEVGVGGGLSWPRDADRLPNGNTLITDSLNHRVIEVTPRGEIVWEYYATWGPYEAERVAHGGGSNGPTMADLNASGSYELSGSAGLTPGTGDGLTFPAAVQEVFAGTPLDTAAAGFAVQWSHVVPWIRPVWMGSWAFAGLACALLVGLCWGAAELVAARDRVVGALRRAGRRVRTTR